jgi:hypothetical protein
MTCFTPLEHALLLDSGAVKADDGTQFAVCPGCVSPEVAAIIDARFEAGSAAAGSSSPAAQKGVSSCAQHEERLVPRVAVLADIGPVLLMRHMPLTDLEQQLLTEGKALRAVTEADTQRIREDPNGGDDAAAQYQTALDLMALKEQAFDFLYFQMYEPCLEWHAAKGAAGAAGGAGQRSGT